MKKRIPIFVFVLLILTLPLLMAPSPPENSSLWWESRAGKFDIDKVEIEVYFGQNRSRNINFEFSEQEKISVFLYDGSDYIWFDDGLPFAELNDDPNFHLLKTIPPEEFYTDEYFVTWIHPWGCSCTSYKNAFNHSEKMQIPQKLFSQDKGIINLIIRIERPVADENGEEVLKVARGEGDYSVIHYKKDGQKVKISREKFK